MELTTKEGRGLPFSDNSFIVTRAELLAIREAVTRLHMETGGLATPEWEALMNVLDAVLVDCDLPSVTGVCLGADGL